jgi:hypothetical protein
MNERLVNINPPNISDHLTQGEFLKSLEILTSKEERFIKCLQTQEMYKKTSISLLVELTDHLQ